MFLLDTSVLSEAQRVKPSPEVQRWLRRQQRIAIPFPVILEIEQGILDVIETKPHKGHELREWLSELLESEFEYPEVTPRVAAILAEMMCCAPLKNFWFINPDGKKDKKPSQDLFIAAVAIVHALPLATLNDRDFQSINRFFPIPGVFNPGSGQWPVAKPGSSKRDFVDMELCVLEAIFQGAFLKAGTSIDLENASCPQSRATLSQALPGPAPRQPEMFLRL
ncbi:PIN domain-containing protein [Neorhizobium sp. BT27B]|uniref:PIN domain-containing protein n=1 Tax=Neorhizobium sp. BT27B TaxID=3142625 RepID=UPI003D2BC91E